MACTLLFTCRALHVHTMLRQHVPMPLACSHSPCPGGCTARVDVLLWCCLLLRAALFDEYKLHKSVRWVVAQKNRVRNGELYRYIAGVQCGLEGVELGLASARTACTALPAWLCLPVRAGAHGSGPCTHVLRSYHSDPGTRVTPYRGGSNSAAPTHVSALPLPPTPG